MRGAHPGGAEPQLTLFGAPEPRRVSLVRLSAEIARSLADIGLIAVEGEVHGVRETRTGGKSFTLRDRAAQIPVWCSGARIRRCRTVVGERVLATGRLTWSNEWGRVQLEAEEVVPVGAGAVAAMVAETRERLAADGLLDRPRRPIPRLPRVIGVVCGTDAAVKADIASVVAVRFHGYPIRWIEAPVSGPSAADAVTEALRVLDADSEVDVILVARGGGDATQLLAFSDEDLCRAICACATPVVTAIGHEGDRPLCDEVADLRCGTPSLAAAAIVPSRVELESELSATRRSLNEALRLRAEREARAISTLDPRRALDARAAGARSRLDRAADRLDLNHPRHRIARSRERLAACRRELDALDPTRVLGRGYAIVRRADGTVVRAASQLAAGDAIDLRLATGSVAAQVTSVDSAGRGYFGSTDPGRGITDIVKETPPSGP